MFLLKCRTTKKFQENGLTARALEKSKSVRVENLPAQCPDDILELYFDKWGGEVERIDNIADEQAAIVTFHHLDGKVYIVWPRNYNECCHKSYHLGYFNIITVEC